MLHWNSILNSESEELGISVGDVTSAHKCLLLVIGAASKISHNLLGLIANQDQLFFKLTIDSIHTFKLQSIHLHPLHFVIDLIPQGCQLVNVLIPELTYPDLLSSL